MIIGKGPEAKRIERIVATLRERGQRVTPQRLAIIEAILCDRRHPTAGEVYEVVHTQHPTMSLMTVYQTLRLLEEIGELRIIYGDAERAHFDGARPEPHAHRICRRCGAIEDVEGLEMSRFADNHDGWAIEGYSLDLLGICPQCRYEADQVYDQ